jgi:hypothetical protein
MAAGKFPIPTSHPAIVDAPMNTSLAVLLCNENAVFWVICQLVAISSELIRLPDAAPRRSEQASSWRPLRCAKKRPARARLPSCTTYEREHSPVARRGRDDTFGRGSKPVGVPLIGGLAKARNTLRVILRQAFAAEVH